MLTYFESGEGHKSLTAGEGFWLEELVDGRWVVLEPASPATAAEEQIQVSWTGTDTVTIDWSDSYGTLERGYFRVVVFDAKGRRAVTRGYFLDELK